MAAFSYVAVNDQGKEQKGLIEADSARQARQQLRGMKLMPVEMEEVTSSDSAKKAKRHRDKLNVATVSLITRQLATLISAGQPVETAYLAVSQQTPKAAAKQVLIAVRNRVMEGYPLSDALREFPRVFDSMYCASVHAGEQSGLLDVVMERLADHMEARQELQRKTGQALIYPILLSLVAFALVTALLTFVVPKIVQVFEGFDQQLPVVTLFLISISDFFKAYGLEILIGFLLLIVAYSQAIKLIGFQRLRDRILLSLPYIRYLVRLANTARFTRTMSILVGSGVPALDAMRISSEVVNNHLIKAAIVKASGRVREGASISDALQKTGYFSPLVLQLVQNGEASGKLGEMLQRSAKSEEDEYSGITSTFISLFEPAMILVMGVVVLFIVVAILIPIFDMNELV